MDLKGVIELLEEVGQEEIVSNNSAANQPEDEKKFKDFDEIGRKY